MGVRNIRKRNIVGCSNRGNILQIKTTITWPFNVQQLCAFSFLVIKSTWLHAANIFILTSFLNCSWRRCSVDNRVYIGRRSKIVRIASSPILRFPFEPSSSALRSRSKQSGSKWTEHNRMSLVTARPTRDMFASHSLILRERLLSENGGNLLLVPYWQIDNHSNIQRHCNTPLWLTEEAINTKARKVYSDCSVRWITLFIS